MEIRVLGELGVADGGHDVALPPSKKTRALLAYLVATAEPQPRKRLCDLLWDGPDDPRAALRWSLTKLRAVFAAEGSPQNKRPQRDGPVVATLEHVAFARGSVSVDLLDHRADVALGIERLDLATLRRVAARFRGDFLEGLELPDCYRFYEWCVAEREALRRDRVAVLAALVERLVDEPEEALAHARAWAQIDPVAEPANVALVELLGRLGRRREALEQYDRCRRLLDAKPSAALENARMALGSGAPKAIASHAAPAPSPIFGGTASAPAGVPPTREPPSLVGRSAELSTLGAALDAARGGASTGPVVVYGDPGVGKTRLVEAFVSKVRDAGGLALSGRAFEAETARPYGPWIDALRSIPLRGIPDSLRFELSSLLPELSDAPAPAADRHRLFDGVARLLAVLAVPGHPAVIVLDDVQWLDDASAALAHFVARGRLAGVLLLLAARPGEIDDNPAALRLLRALRREDQLDEIGLAPLSSEHTVEIVRRIAPAADVAKIFTESEGNPLFAIELGRAAARPANGDRLPSTLVGLLRDRLSQLDERGNSVVAWAATLGRSFELGVLADVTGRATPEVLSIIEDLERRGVFRSAPAGTTQFGYDFSHDLIRRAAYDQLSEPRRRLHHAHVAEILARSLDEKDSIAGDVVHHAALAGNDALAAKAAVPAARRCLRLFAYAEAAEIADRGLHHAARLGGALALFARVSLLTVLAEADPIRRGDQLEADLTREIEAAATAGNHDLVTEAYRALGMLQHSRGDIERSAATLERGSEIGRQGSIETVVGAIAQAGRCYAMIRHELGRARTLLGEAVTLSERHGIANVEIPFGLACLRQFDGDAEEADRLFREALAIVRATSDHWRECECLIRMTMGALDRSDWNGAKARARELVEVAAKMGDGGSEPQVAETLAAVADLGAGDPGAAERVDASIDKLRAIDTKGMLSYVLATVAALDLDRDESQSAERRAREAFEMGVAIKSDDDAAFACVVLAKALFAQHRESDAREFLDEARARAAKADAVSARVRKALGAVEFGREPNQ